MGQSTRKFMAGLLAGTLVGGSAVLAMTVGPGTLFGGQDAPEVLGRLMAWTWRNLGFSLPVFGVVLGLYATSLVRLRRALARSAPPDEVRQADHLSDVWTSLFFGVGVIWTAIGMRGALVEALTGGANGLFNIPAPTFAGYDLSRMPMTWLCRGHSLKWPVRPEADHVPNL